MGRWKEEMEVEFVKLSNRVSAIEVMHEAYHKSQSNVYHRCGLLEDQVKILQDQVAQLLSSRPDNAMKSYKQIQEDWYARHSDMAKSPPDIKHFENKSSSQNLPFVRRDRPC
jgi:hypothetical protein